MNMTQYFHERGADGICELAKRAGTTPGYLRRMIYQQRVPSMAMAERLVSAAPELTYKGLANPVKMTLAEAGIDPNQRKKKGSK